MVSLVLKITPSSVEYVYKCSECLITFTRFQDLKSHLPSHALRKCKSQSSLSPFLDDKRLRVHVRKHADEKPYKCSRCGVSFAKAANICMHFCTNENENPPNGNVSGIAIDYDAVIPEASAISDDYSVADTIVDVEKCRNQLQIPKNKRPHVCADCGRAFKMVHHLKRHHLVHSTERPWKCSECSATYKLKSYLIRHHSHVHINGNPSIGFEPVIPEDKASTTRDYYSVAGTIVDDDKFRNQLLVPKNERPHVCTDCGTTFRRLHHLKQHRVVHSDERPWKCTECIASYKTEKHLKRHHLLHTREHKRKRLGH